MPLSRAASNGPVFAVMITSFVLAAALDAGVPPPWLSPPTPAAAAVTSGGRYQLRRHAQGWRYHGQQFDAQVAPDGTVKFHDHHGTLALFLPLPIPQPLPAGTPSVEGAVRAWIGQRRSTGGGWAGGGAIRLCDYRDACFLDPSATLLSVSGTFDLGDEVLRALGHDPYRQEKARFLAVTADFRTRLARSDHARALAAAEAQLTARLGGIWRDARLTPDQRRRVVVALWQETSDDVGGAAARAIIERFLRARTGRPPGP